MRLPAKRPLTYFITAGELTDGDFALQRPSVEENVRAAVEAGVSMVQVREKRLSARNIFDLAAALAKITRNSDTRLLINDRADVAKAAGADGVHLTTRSLSTSLIRRMFGEEFLIGVSTHSVEEIRSAIDSKADFAVFGPVFAVPHKGEPVGVKVLDDVCTEFGSFPIIAIGGIDKTNFSPVIETKAAGFAAIRAFNDIGSMRQMLDKIRMVKL